MPSKKINDIRLNKNVKVKNILKSWPKGKLNKAFYQFDVYYKNQMVARKDEIDASGIADFKKKLKREY